MKILIDLGHPAHIHYFRNFVSIMESQGHEFRFIARDKEVLHKLLDNYGFKYTTRGKGGKSLLSKALYIIKADCVILTEARKFKPDIFLSFSSTYAAHVSWLMQKPHIVLDDTEHAKFELLMYPPFSNVILNPTCFYKKFSYKQLFFASYMELFYLNPKYFSPDAEIVRSYGIDLDKPFFIVRFVSWNASHDIGQQGLSFKTKISLIEKLKVHGTVLISSEGKLPNELAEYQIRINPVHLHHFLAFASLYIGEGSTTASECAVLATPNIYVNSLVVGYCKEQEEVYGLCNQITDAKELEKKIDFFINTNFSRAEFESKRKKMLEDKIDGTAFLAWFVENYPQSEKIMRKNPDYQYNFR